MKKFCAIILTLVLTFALAGCITTEPIQQEALDTLETAIHHISDMKAANYSAILNATSGEDYTTLSLAGAYRGNPSAYNVKITMESMSDGESYQFDNYLTMAMDEAYAYTNYMDMLKYKTAVTSETSQESVVPSESTKIECDDLKPYLTTAALQANNIQLEFDMDKLGPILKEILADETVTSADPTGSVTSIAQAYTNLNIEDIIVNVTVKGKMLSDVELSVEATDQTTGENIENNLRFKVSFTDINGDIKVEMPTDIDTYELMEDTSTISE